MQLYELIEMRKKKGKLDNELDKAGLIQAYLRWYIGLTTSEFVYDGVPDWFDTMALETILLQGEAIVSTTGDKSVMPFPYAYDVTEYTALPFYNRYDEAGYANAVSNQSNLKINEDCVIFRDNEADLHLIDILKKSAVLLAEMDLSLSSIMINSRMTGVFTVKDSKTMSSVERFYEKLIDGQFGVIDSTDEGIMNMTNYIPFGQATSGVIRDLITAKNNEIRNTLKIVGIDTSIEKNEAVLSTESESSRTLLKMSLDSRLMTRKRSLETLNRLLDLDISVRLNNNLMYEETEEIEKNDNTRLDAG